MIASDLPNVLFSEKETTDEHTHEVLEDPTLFVRVLAQEHSGQVITSVIFRRLSRADFSLQRFKLVLRSKHIIPLKLAGHHTRSLDRTFLAS
jgi:hypothetical protein